MTEFQSKQARLATEILRSVEQWRGWLEAPGFARTAELVAELEDWSQWCIEEGRSDWAEALRPPLSRSSMPEPVGELRTCLSAVVQAIEAEGLKPLGDKEQPNIPRIIGRGWGGAISSAESLDSNEPGPPRMISRKGLSTDPKRSVRSRAKPKESPRPIASPTICDEQPAPFGSFRRPQWWRRGLLVLGLLSLSLVLASLLWQEEQSSEGRAVSEALSTGALPSAPSGASKSKSQIDQESLRALAASLQGHGESEELAQLLRNEERLALLAMGLECANGDEGKGLGCEARAGWKQLLNLKPLVLSSRTKKAPKWMKGLVVPALGAPDEAPVLEKLEFYTKSARGRAALERLLFECGTYGETIAPELIRSGLPPELLAVVFAESSCRPAALSEAGALGLWQFMPGTARAYRLAVVDGVVDERLSPAKSTRAAVKFLSDLRKKLGSWELALAGYNLGPFGVLARLRRSGASGFWDLAHAGLLPRQTAEYVPKIQAFAIILTNLEHFGFQSAQRRQPSPTAELSAPIGTRLGQIARAAAISVEEVRRLNPDWYGTVVPRLLGGKTFVPRVPEPSAFRARQQLERLLEKGGRQDLCVSDRFNWGADVFTARIAKNCSR